MKCSSEYVAMQYKFHYVCSFEVCYLLFLFFMKKVIFTCHYRNFSSFFLQWNSRFTWKMILGYVFGIQFYMESLSFQCSKSYPIEIMIFLILMVTGFELTKYFGSKMTWEVLSNVRLIIDFCFNVLLFIDLSVEEKKWSSNLILIG